MTVVACISRVQRGTDVGRLRKAKAAALGESIPWYVVLELGTRATIR